MKAAAPCPQQRLLSLEAAAGRLGVNVETVRSMWLEGKLDGQVIRGRLRVTLASVRRVMAARKFREKREAGE